MKSVSFTAFRKMDIEEVKELGNIQITFNGELAFFVIFVPSAAKRAQLEAIGDQINAAMGKS